MNRHQRRTQGLNIGAMDLRYGGNILNIDVHLAMPGATVRDELLRVGSEAAVMLERVVRGPLHHAAHVAATSEREPGFVRVKIICVVNSPETIEQLAPRVQALIAEGRWAVIYCSIVQADDEEAANAWATVRALANGLGAVEAKPS